MADAEVLALELVSDPRHLPEVRRTLRGWLTDRHWTDCQCAEIILAVDEALTNVIRHAYGGAADQKILMELRRISSPDEGEGVEIQIRDFGPQVDPQQIKGRDLDEIRPGGLGVHIIRAMTNSAEYSQAEGGGMRLRLCKFKTHQATTGQQATGGCHGD